MLSFADEKHEPEAIIEVLSRIAKQWRMHKIVYFVDPAARNDEPPIVEPGDRWEIMLALSAAIGKKRSVELSTLLKGTVLRSAVITLPTTKTHRAQTFPPLEMPVGKPGAKVNPYVTIWTSEEEARLAELDRVASVGAV
jgi:hypothetical protein